MSIKSQIDCDISSSSDVPVVVPVVGQKTKVSFTSLTKKHAIIYIQINSCGIITLE